MGINYYVSRKYGYGNAGYIAKNAISNFLWDGKPFCETIKSAMEHDMEYPSPFTPHDVLFSAVRSILLSMQTEDGIRDFFKVTKYQYVRPCYKNVSEWIKGEFERDFTAQELANIVASQTF